MKVTIELIDELRSRVNISYEDAKRVLERNDGDLIKSIIEIENSKSGKNIKSNKRKIKNHSLDNFVKSLLSFKFSITKNNCVVLNIPVVLAVLIVWLSFWVSLALIILAIITSCKFKLYTVENIDDNIGNNNSKENINNEYKYSNNTCYNNNRHKDNKSNKKDDCDENEIIIE